MGRQTRPVVNLKFKGLIGQGNNTDNGLFDKIAAEFNKHADVKVTGKQVLRKWKKWKGNWRQQQANGQSA